MRVSIEVMNPLVPDEGVQEVVATTTLGNINGARIGFLNNTKPGADMLQPFIERELKKRFPNLQLQSWTVPFPTPQPAKDLILQQIAESSDAVIAGVGD